MSQRNIEQQSQWEMAIPGRLESQMNTMLNAARALAGAAPPGTKEVPGEQYLIFSLLDREFAIKAEYIQGVERLGDVTPVPNVASWVAGVINLRGSISSVVDLRAFLDMERLPFNPRTRLLSVKYNDMVICLVVDSVNEMVPVLPKAIDNTTRGIPQWVASYASGTVAVGKRRVILLDAARLLFSDKMHHYSA
ncbi:MAG TPA: chemotaxis protein CheW [Ktedonobacteraceae bacterium]|nr:chemotaxis protein CheW [Ktedonobacteraceae bacterium]